MKKAHAFGAPRPEDIEPLEEDGTELTDEDYEELELDDLEESADWMFDEDDEDNPLPIDELMANTTRRRWGHDNG